MISILIPVFNKNIHALVNALQDQLAALDPITKCEILVIDDGSDVFFRDANRCVSNSPFVTYLELQENVGRNRIRQLLAQKANFEWLLFLDGDSKILSDHFVLAYQRLITHSPDVVIGGRQYDPSRPTECRLRLHWKYGTQRESADHKAPGRHYYLGFMSNNFLINRRLFEQIQVIDDLEDYGHEDTWIGIELERLNAKITFLDNRVLHDGLEDVERFILKSRSAVKNLKILSGIVPVDILKKHVKLFRYYMLARRTGSSGLISILYSVAKPLIIRNLHSCNPSLPLFDFYRLNLLISLDQK